MMMSATFFLLMAISADVADRQARAKPD